MTLSAVQPSEPWGSFSNPNAHELRPSELFSFPTIDGPFQNHLSAPAIRYQIESTRPSCFSGLLPLGKLPFTVLKYFVQDGTQCSPGLSDLLGISLRPTFGKSISLFPLPSRPFCPQALHSACAVLDLRVPAGTAWHFPFIQGAPTHLAFFTHCRSLAFRKSRATDYFFILRSPGSHELKAASLSGQ